MKKILILMLFFALQGCKSTDATPASVLLGSWKNFSFKGDYTINGKSGTVNSSTGETLTFQDKGIFTDTKNSGTYTINGTTLSINITGSAVYDYTFKCGGRCLDFKTEYGTV